MKKQNLLSSAGYLFHSPKRALVSAALIGALFFLGGCAATQREKEQESAAGYWSARVTQEALPQLRVDLLQSRDAFLDFLKDEAAPYSEQQRKVILRDYALRKPLIFLADADKIAPPEFRDILIAKARDTKTILDSLAVYKMGSLSYGAERGRAIFEVSSFLVNPIIRAEIKAHPNCYRIMDQLLEIPIDYMMYYTFSPSQVIGEMNLSKEQKRALLNKAAGRSELLLYRILSHDDRPDYISGIHDLIPALRDQASYYPGTFINNWQNLVVDGFSVALLKECKQTALKSLHQLLNNDTDKQSDASREASAYCHTLDYNHSLPDSERFGDLAAFSPTALIKMLDANGKRTYTSTFIGLTKALMASLEKRGEKLDLYVKNGLGQELNNVFVIATGFGLSNTILEGFPSHEMRADFAKSLMQDLKNDFTTVQGDYIPGSWTPQLLAINEIIDNVRGTKQQKDLEQALAALYKNTHLPQAKMLCGQAISAYVATHPDRASAFESIDALSANPVMTKEILTEDQLFKNGRCVARLIFSYDKDSQDSYNHFVSSIKRANGWKITDKPDFIVIERTLDKRSMLIVANKPLRSQLPSAAVQTYLSDIDAKPSIVALRGHSFFVSGELRYINPEACIVFDGGCGGYDRTRNVLEIANDCVTLNTKQEGTMLINTPLLLLLADMAFENGKVNLRTFAQRADAIIKDKRLANYIFPHENYAEAMLRSETAFKNGGLQALLPKPDQPQRPELTVNPDGRDGPH